MRDSLLRSAGRPEPDPVGSRRSRGTGRRAMGDFPKNFLPSAIVNDTVAFTYDSDRLWSGTKRMEGKMSLMQNRWFRRFGFGALAALSLCAAAMSTTPAQARDFGFGSPARHAVYVPRHYFGFGGFGGEHHWYRGDHRWH